MSLLTVPTVRNSHILAGIYFVFLKPHPRPKSKVLQYQIWTLKKDRKISFHVRQISALFCNLIALILVYNSVKDLRATKIVKQIKFERTWGKLEAKNCFLRQPRTKYLRKTLVSV